MAVSRPLIQALLCNIPLRWLMFFPFVLQFFVWIGLVSTGFEDHSNYLLSFYGCSLLLLILFAISANRLIIEPILGLTHICHDIFAGNSLTSQPEESPIAEIQGLLQSVDQMARQMQQEITDINNRQISERVLRQSESQLKAFLDNAPTPITIKDLEGTYISVNSEFSYWVQLPESEIVNKRDYDIFPQLNGKDARQYELQAIFEEIAVSFEESIPMPDGLHTFIITKFPLLNENNKPYAVGGIYLDISDRKLVELALEETEANLRRANQELERLVNLDGLTQIANRRCFNDRIAYEWNRLHREGKPLSLLMFDVDYFKRYNDLYGHQLGDECLIRIAQTVHHLVQRPADLVARYVGEEFIVILPNTNISGAIAVAKRIYNGIKELKIPHLDSEVSDIVTVSQGIACTIPDLERSPYTLIQNVDLALYQAKQQGRNQSVVFA